jgi:hypothetical protein
MYTILFSVDAGYNDNLVAKETPKFITSPGYPDTAMGNIHASWTIWAEGNIIGLQVKSIFNIDYLISFYDKLRKIIII